MGLFEALVSVCPCVWCEWNPCQGSTAELLTVVPIHFMSLFFPPTGWLVDGILR